MKKTYFILSILISCLAINSNAQTITWTDSFTSGVNPTPAQVANWNNFRSQLLSSYCYTKMTISGTFDTAGQVCNDPTIVLAYANALRSLTSYTSPLTNGNVWSLCATRYQGEVWLNPPSECSPSNCPFGYIIRPGGPGAQYGGVNSNTCSPPSQTMTFTFEYAPTGAPTVNCPTNIIVSNDLGNCDAVVSYNLPSVFSCDSFTITQTAGLPSGSTFPVGTTTNTFSVTNGTGTNTCSFTVTVNDTTNPTVSCPANVTTCNPIVNNIAPTSSDNCTGETVSYTLSGATTGAGTGDASGTSFGVGVTTVTYVATDASNNQDSCSFTVTVNPLPSVAIASFSPDTVCETDPAINLPVGTPASGTYSGNGVVGTTFDPNTAGVGVHYVVYSFTDSNSCTNMDSTMIVVESCVGIDENGTLSGVNIYPNPTSNNLTIELGVLSTEVNLTLTSVEGKIVYQENSVTTSKVSVDMSNNSKGIYFLRVEANNQYKVYKVVKE